MLDPKIHRERRERYLQETAPGVSILFAAPVANRNADVDYEYRPDSNLYYLTGFPEPGAVLVLSPNHPEHRFTLFVRPRNPEREVWDGLRAGEAGARERYGADVAYPIEQLGEKLPEYLENQSLLYHRLGHNPEHDATVLEALRKVQAKVRTGVTWPTTFKDPAEVLAEMRVFKRPEDLECLRRAASITAEAHQEAMRAARPGAHEYEVEAVIEYVFRKRGSASWGYPSICGSGPNSCILHYNENTRQMRDGELLLVDAGAEWELFTGDCTRTFPVSGRFTEPQRRIYALCLAAQKAAVEAARAGNAFFDVHKAAVKVIAGGLVDLGLIAGPVEKAIEEETYSRFFMHKTSHWLGMDVHDAGAYKREGDWRKLEPGMVLTVEPGIYIAENSEGVDPKWWNIGVRIEDDVLITAEGNEVLTAEAPKEIEDVERLCQQESRYA